MLSTAPSTWVLNNNSNKTCISCKLKEALEVFKSNHLVHLVHSYKGRSNMAPVGDGAIMSLPYHCKRSAPIKILLLLYRHKIKKENLY